MASKSKKRRSNIFEIDEILDDRPSKQKQAGGREYLIRWDGYDASYDSWEPEDNIMDEDLLNEYKKSKKFKQRSKSTSGQAEPLSVKQASVDQKEKKKRTASVDCPVATPPRDKPPALPPGTKIYTLSDMDVLRDRPFEMFLGVHRRELDGDKPENVYTVKFTDSNKLELVNRDLAHSLWPKELLHYYEEGLCFDSNSCECPCAKRNS